MAESDGVTFSVTRITSWLFGEKTICQHDVRRIHVDCNSTSNRVKSHITRQVGSLTIWSCMRLAGFRRGMNQNMMCEQKHCLQWFSQYSCPFSCLSSMRIDNSSFLAVSGDYHFYNAQRISMPAASHGQSASDFIILDSSKYFALCD